MKNLTNIQPQTQPNSIADYTPGEMAEIEQYQNKNRGFRDESDEDLENFFDWED